jgi:hypothetical protein
MYKISYGQLGLGGAEMKDITTMLKLVNIEDPIAFLSTQLEKELNNRGIPAKCVVGQSGGQKKIRRRYGRGIHTSYVDP